MLPPFSMRRPVPAASLAALFCVVTVARGAQAQIASGEGSSSLAPPSSSSSSPPPGPVSESLSAAVLHYERGRSYYAVGRYRSAIAELETAIRLDPAGFNLYFDLGLVYERVGMTDRALAAYRRYLDHLTDPAERERAERIVARLQGARVEIEDMRTHRGRADVWFWSATAASVAALVTTGIVLTAAWTAPSSASTPPLELAGGTTLSISAGLALTAAVLYFARDAVPRELSHCITASIDARGPRLTVAFDF